MYACICSIYVYMKENFEFHSFCESHRREDVKDDRKALSKCLHSRLLARTVCLLAENRFNISRTLFSCIFNPENNILDIVCDDVLLFQFADGCFSRLECFSYQFLPDSRFIKGEASECRR